MNSPRVLSVLRALGADVEHLPEIPPQLSDYIAALTPEGLERINRDVRELERIGLVPTLTTKGTAR